MTVDEVLAAAREALIEFSEVEFTTDAELYEELHAEDCRTVERIVGYRNPAYPLSDLCARSTQIDTIRGPYPLPDDFWLPRRLEVEYESGRAANVRMRPPSSAHTIPAAVPAAFLHRGLIHTIDGLFDGDVVPLDERRWGWDGAVALSCWYVAQPAAIEDGADVLGSPDDARTYLARFIAEFMAVRARIEEVPLRIIQGRTTSARKELETLVRDYGLTDV